MSKTQNRNALNAKDIRIARFLPTTFHIFSCKKKSPVKSYETKSNLIESPRSSYSIINKSNTIGASETRPLVLL